MLEDGEKLVANRLAKFYVGLPTSLLAATRHPRFMGRSGAA